MIDEKFLIKAAQIRREYLSLKSEITQVEKKVLGFLPLLEENQSELENIKKEVDTGKLTDKTTFSNKLLNIIATLEQETSNYDKLVKQIQDRIDQLRDDEDTLYNKIKNQYTDLPMSVIKQQVDDYLKSQNLLPASQD